jgi:hypothetical protein
MVRFMADVWCPRATLSPDERSVYYHKRDGAKFVIYRASK